MKNYNNKVHGFMTLAKKHTGEVGIEIECEGARLPTAELITKYWVTHVDGSLRGESCEYVLAKPVDRDNVNDALTYLNTVFTAAESQISDSYRTSVHVHLNAQDIQMRQVLTWVCLYIILEELLVDFTGADRVGNLFCLRASDAEYLIKELKKSVKTDGYMNLGDQHLRYASCNVTSLAKYGSLEFRALRGTTDTKIIELWTKMLLCIKDYSLTLDHPGSLIVNFSEFGAKRFLEKVFSGDMEILNVFGQMQDVPNKLLEGVRLIQGLATSHNWEVQVPTEEEVKAKGRKRAKAVRGPELDAFNIAPEWGAPAPIAPRGLRDNIWNVVPAPQEARMHNLRIEPHDDMAFFDEQEIED